MRHPRILTVVLLASGCGFVGQVHVGAQPEGFAAGSATSISARPTPTAAPAAAGSARPRAR